MNIAEESSEMAEKLKACGCFYTWGRKDPQGRISTLSSLSPAALVNCYAGYDDISPVDIKNCYSELASDTSFESIINNYITAPSTFFGGIGSSFKSGAAVSGSKLWGGLEVSLKTVFDPCPSGYKVSDQKTWAWVNKNTMSFVKDSGYSSIYTSASDGTTYYDFFPCLGLRSYYNTLDGVGNNSIMYCCEAQYISGKVQTYGMDIINGTYTPFTVGGTVSATQIRCMKIE